jgi:hypothetical protein
MQALSLVVFAIVVVSIALKLAAREATRMKQKMASFDMQDPVVNLFAWFDRITTFHHS